MEINAESPKEKAPAEFTPEKSNDVIKDYILDGVIENTYTNKNLSVTFRVPTQGQLMQQQEEIDREVFSEDENISVDRTNLIRNNNLIAIYLSGFGKTNFSREQGDEYFTKDGLMKRKKFIMDSPTINVYTMAWIIDKLTEFQESVTAAFKEDNLKNS